MSYRIYSNYANMIPATLENIKKFGISFEELPEPYDYKNTEETPIEDWYQEVLGYLSDDGISLTASFQGKNFCVYPLYLSEDDCEFDDTFNDGEGYFFIVPFAELYEPTPLLAILQKEGLKEYTWVTGG